MPDITYSLTLDVSKDNLANRIQVTQITASMTKAGYKSVTYDLTTTATVISTANLSAVGMAFLRNLSTAVGATAQIGFEAGGSFVSFATLRAGEPALLRLSAGTEYQAIGSSGARIRVDITEG
jgi:hypothetical protein